MVLWRISRHQDLTGAGGLRVAGRWHLKGSLVVYTSEHPAVALLESCVHTATNDVPKTYTLLRIEGPDISAPSVKLEDLPKDWMERVSVTQALGSEWLSKNDAPLLRIPSVIVPYAWNFLFNPLHYAARLFAITEAINYPFDGRIKQ